MFLSVLDVETVMVTLCARWMCCRNSWRPSLCLPPPLRSTQMQQQHNPHQQQRMQQVQYLAQQARREGLGDFIGPGGLPVGSASVGGEMGQAMHNNGMPRLENINSGLLVLPSPPPPGEGSPPFSSISSSSISKSD